MDVEKYRCFAVFSKDVRKLDRISLVAIFGTSRYTDNVTARTFAHRPASVHLRMQTMGPVCVCVHAFRLLPTPSPAPRPSYVEGFGLLCLRSALMRELILLHSSEPRADLGHCEVKAS